MVSYLLPCATTGLSRIGRWYVMGETPWGQPWPPVLTRPPVRAGLRVLLIAVWCPFRRLSMCRPGHRQLTRNALLDLTTIVPATACHQRNYIETYSRYIGGYAEFRNMRSEQLSSPGIHSQSADVLRIFLVSVGTTNALGKSNSELIEATNTALLLASAPTSALLGS
jgi:hypothetical protein